MALLKLGLVRKKVLLFVNSVDTGYRLKLFLESFGVRAALLNAELPINSRCVCGAAGARLAAGRLLAGQWVKDSRGVAFPTPYMRFWGWLCVGMPGICPAWVRWSDGGAQVWC
jgi:hypothetical protein